MSPHKSSAIKWLTSMGYEPVTKTESPLFDVSNVMEALSVPGGLPCPHEVFVGISTHQYECKVKGCSDKTPIGLIKEMVRPSTGSTS